MCRLFSGVLRNLKGVNIREVSLDIRRKRVHIGGVLYYIEEGKNANCSLLVQPFYTPVGLSLFLSISCSLSLPLSPSLSLSLPLLSLSLTLLSLSLPLLSLSHPPLPRPVKPQGVTASLISTATMWRSWLAL